MGPIISKTYLCLYVTESFYEVFDGQKTALLMINTNYLIWLGKSESDFRRRQNIVFETASYLPSQITK